MKRRFLYIAAVAAVLLVVAVRAQADGAGTSGAAVLQQMSGARPAGLAGAYTAVSGDLYTLASNPAGLSDLKQTEIVFMNTTAIEGVSLEWLGGAMPLSGLGVLAAQVLYRGQPSIDNQVPGEAPVNVNDMLFGLSFAAPITAGISAGVNAQAGLLTLGPVSPSIFSLDLGVQYAFDDYTRIGLAMRHLGTPVTIHGYSDPLPLTLAGGAAYLPIAGGAHELRTIVDMDYVIPDQDLTARVGVEYTFKKLLALRLGYAYSAIRNVNGLAAGVGFRFKIGDVGFLLDYALRPQIWSTADFESENLLSLGVNF